MILHSIRCISIKQGFLWQVSFVRQQEAFVFIIDCHFPTHKCEGMKSSEPKYST